MSVNTDLLQLGDFTHKFAISVSRSASLVQSQAEFRSRARPVSPAGRAYKSDEHRLLGLFLVSSSDVKGIRGETEHLFNLRIEIEIEISNLRPSRVLIAVNLKQSSWFRE